MFWHRSKKEKLQGIKTVYIGGLRYSIKRLNPLLDFSLNEMPQIFASFVSQRKTDPAFSNDPKKVLSQMMAVVQAGLVKPELVQVGKGELRGKEEGITIEDIFRDENTAGKLFTEIIIHSLNKFKGLKGLFFYLKIRAALYTDWQKNMENYRQILSQTPNP